MEKIHEEATDEKTPPALLRELAKINPTIASLVANNPNADPELLRELADSEDDLIKKNVAANPNTPKEVLWWLGEEFPAEVLGNAVFPLLLLENPNLLEEIPQETLISFLKCSTVPISFMEWALKVEWNKQLALSMTTISHTPRTILEELASSEQKTVVVGAELHVNYAGQLEKDWQVEFRHHLNRSFTFLDDRGDERINADRYFVRILAAMGLVPEFVFELLARHEEIQVRCLVAQSDRLPLNLLEELGRDSQPEVRGAVARNPIAPAELLDRLAKDKSWAVRSHVAENLNLPPKIFDRLARDEQKEVREKVAKNPNAPAYLLEELARDEGVFLAVASNPNTPKVALEQLARYKLERHQKLKIILAANANTPVELLEKLERERQEVFRHRLAGNPSTPTYFLEQLARSKKDWFREAVASNPKIPKNLIHLLAKDKSSGVRRALAANPKTLLAVLLRLQRDKRPEVRRAVTANPKAPFSILEEGFSDLFTSESNNALQFFATFPKHSPGQSSDFFSDFTEKAETKAVLRYLREKPEELPVLLELIVVNAEHWELSRTIALLHPQMPANVLAENGRSLNWLDRCAIAQNPNTPTETLQLLAIDGNRIVRAAAKENLDRKLNT